jgi:uncharacterized protein YbaR (Trm112 family)
VSPVVERLPLQIQALSAVQHSVAQYYVARYYNDVSMISQDLLAMLVCPLCKKPVVLNVNGQSLKCGECRRVYPIQDDIPIMLVDAATIDGA